MNTLHQVGFDAAIESITLRRPTELVFKLAALSAMNGQTEAMHGVLAAFCLVLDSASQVRIDTDNQRINDLLNQPPKLRRLVLAAMAEPLEPEAVEEMRDLCAVMDSIAAYVTFSAPSPARPVEVVVVGLPERIRVAAVSRGADGNIETLEQIERDRKPAEVSA